MSSHPSRASRDTSQPLSPKQAEAWALRDAGLTLEAIALQLGISINAVWDRLYPERRLVRQREWRERKRGAA